MRTAGASRIFCSCLGTNSKSQERVRVFQERAASITPAPFFLGATVLSAGHIRQTCVQVITNLFQARDPKNDLFGCSFFPTQQPSLSASLLRLRVASVWAEERGFRSELSGGEVSAALCLSGAFSDPGGRPGRGQGQPLPGSPGPRRPGTLFLVRFHIIPVNCRVWVLLSR